MPARIVTYVGDTPMEIHCATCNFELEDEDDRCPNGCDALEKSDVGDEEFKRITDFKTICQIFSSLYSNYLEQGPPGEGELKNFIDQEGLGLMVAFTISMGLVEATDEGEQYIYNTWEQFLSSLGLKDLGWKTLAEILKSWVYKMDKGLNTYLITLN